MSSKEELVAQIKALQRSSQEAKEAWWAFCDESSGGVRDPARHDENILAQFISLHGKSITPISPRASSLPPPAQRSAPPLQNPASYQRSQHYPVQQPHHAQPWGASDPGALDFASWIKLGQRASGNWKQAWSQYCSLYGGGINDPSRHDQSHLVSFADYLGQLALADLQASGVCMPHEAPRRHDNGIWAGARHIDPGASDWAREGDWPPAKRPRHEEPAADDLVGRVKALQRQSPEAKQAWQDFCSGHPSQPGVKDPAKHTPEDLQSFLAQHAPL